MYFHYNTNYLNISNKIIIYLFYTFMYLLIKGCNSLKNNSKQLKNGRT